MDEHKSSTMENKAMSHVSDSERQSWVSIAFIWIGTMICIPMLMVGGLFSASMTFGSIVLAALLGFGLCCIIMTLTGIEGTDLGLPCYMCATKGFGDKGSSYLMSIIIFAGQLGWFGIQTTACASAFCNLMQSWNVNFPMWLACIIWGAVMLITAVYGVKWMSLLNYIAVPLLVILCLYGAFHSISGAGWSSIAGTVSENLMSLPAAVSTVIGLFALGATCNSDYTRYCRSRGDVIKATVLGVLPAAVLMIMVGAIMALGTGSYDVTSMFAGLGLPFVAMLVLILATWTTNTGNAYMAGLAACKIFSIKDRNRPKATMAVGALGTVIAIAGLASVLEGFINIVGATVPPIMGIVIADYWVVCKGKAESWKPQRGVNWAGITAWALGGGLALGETLGLLHIFSPALDGVVIAFVAYIVLYKALCNTKFIGQGEMTIEEATAQAQ